MFKDFFSYVLFQSTSYVLNVGQAFRFILGLVFVFFIYRFFSRFWLKHLTNKYDITQKSSDKIQRAFSYLCILIVLLLAVFSLGLNKTFVSRGGIDITLSLIIEAFIIVQFARIFDWFISNIFIHNYYTKRDELYKKQDNKAITDSESNAAKIVQYIVYALAIILILKSFNLDYKIYDIQYDDDKIISFHLTNIISAVLIILFARLIIWLLTQLILYGLYRRKAIDLGAQYAINQLLKYVIYVVAVVLALQKLGLDMTLILGGAAALLVGVGLGLQQTFNDFFSGIVLLFEQSISVGDILEVEGQVGTVKKIGLRSSIIETRGNISLVVPNSKLVSNSVFNWTHFDDKVRFNINVGVAYNSDVDLVKKILLDAADSSPYILKFPAPFVRLLNFGDNSLDFSLYFFSRSYLMIEDVNSDLRFEITKAFQNNGVTIPFPQRDIQITNLKDLKS